MTGIFLLLFCYLMGCVLSTLMHHFIPGSVLGMLLLFGALSLRWIRPAQVEGVSRFLLRHMMLFFVPVGVGLITSYSLLSHYMVAIIVASLASTVLVIAVVGWVEQRLERRMKHKTSLSKPHDGDPA
ncbi:MAG: CidA/LrgA family protein [Alistipes sp.]|nr:CidA/LrgA family protein [Alistipes sp.]